MYSADNIGLGNVQGVYSGAEYEMWELVMGQQIHIGGLKSSMALADAAGIGAGMSGVDLCCCTGAGMVFLTQIRGAESITGVDATERMVETGKARCQALGLEDRVRFVLEDASATGLPGSSADFVWGEDAWCYVEDKKLLVQEAARLVKPGGVVAFTDWVAVDKAMTAEEAQRFLRFMKFPNIFSLSDYADALKQNGLEVTHAGDTGRFAPYLDLYLQYIDAQFAYDVLKLIGFDMGMMEQLAAEMSFMRDLGHAGKVCQGMFVAKKVS